MAPTSSIPSDLWVIFDHNNRVIESTTDPEMANFMTTYVANSRFAGTDWRMVHYKVAVDEAAESDKISIHKAHIG